MISWHMLDNLECEHPKTTHMYFNEITLWHNTTIDPFEKWLSKLWKIGIPSSIFFKRKITWEIFDKRNAKEMIKVELEKKWNK
jgi:hypothetical protein